MHELSDNELLSGCVACTSKPIELVESIVRDAIIPKTVNEDESVVEERFKCLIEFLASKNVPFTKEDQIIKVGPVQIERPYRADNLKSSNLLALQRTKNLLASVLST
jgi:hypothetical protein